MSSQKIEQALLTLVETFQQIHDFLQYMEQDVNELKNEVKALNDQVQTQEVDNLPDWIDAHTAMKILNITDVDTLRGYAKRGMITQTRAANRKNYYPKIEVLALPGKLVEMGIID